MPGIWSPYLVKDKLIGYRKSTTKSIENCSRSKTMRKSCGKRCKLLNWNTLQRRREWLSLVECYNTVFGLNGLDFNDYFEYYKLKNARGNHPYKMQTKSAKVNSVKYSFFVRIIKDGNNLPNHLYVNKFKIGLKKVDEQLMT